MQMSDIIAKISQRNQAPIPDEVCLTATPFSLESAYGSVKPSTRPEDFEELFRSVKDAKAEDTARELTG